MPICPDDLKSFAVLHAASVSDEAHIRASVSRAYYAAFHALVPIANHLPPSSNVDRRVSYMSHHEVISRLKEWKPASAKLARLRTTARTLAQVTSAARASRVRADYSLDQDVDIDDATTQLVRVRQILRIVSQISADISAP